MMFLESCLIMFRVLTGEIAPVMAVLLTVKNLNMIHELKTHPEPFEDICSGIKTFEYRKNDRNFKKGDSLWLRKFNPDLKFYHPNKDVTVVVTHIVYGPNFGVPDGYCIM